MVRPLIFASIKAVSVAVVFVVAAFVFRLGYVLLPVTVAGGVVVLIATRHETRASSRAGPVVAVALCAYGLATLALYQGLTDQRDRRVFAMSWRDNGTQNQFGESEVILEFERFPGQSVGIYSTALRDHLHTRGERQIDVEFEVIQDFWCVRGFREVRIADIRDLAALKRSGGYARRRGNAPSPWGTQPWWCSVNLG